MAVPRLANLVVASREFFQPLETPYGRLTVFAGDNLVNASLRDDNERSEAAQGLLRALVEEGSTIVDVGAYVGMHTLAFSRFVGPTGAVVAIEPQTHPFALLARNVEANGLTNVRAENVRVSNRPADANPDGELASGTARTTTIDALGLADCALIRIDLEGEEESVLRGAIDTLQRSAPAVYVECNSLEHGLKSLDALRDLGYRVLMHVVSVSDVDAKARHDQVTSGTMALIGVTGPHIERIERRSSRLIPSRAITARAASTRAGTIS